MTTLISHRLPTVEEYNELRKLAEWPTYDEHLVTKALSNSLFSTVVHDDQGQILGMEESLATTQFICIYRM
jgi:hypothetical protein